MANSPTAKEVWENLIYQLYESDIALVGYTNKVNSYAANQMEMKDDSIEKLGGEH